MRLGSLCTEFNNYIICNDIFYGVMFRNYLRVRTVLQIIQIGHYHILVSFVTAVIAFFFDKILELPSHCGFFL